jgi:L-asparaginase
MSDAEGEPQPGSVVRPRVAVVFTGGTISMLPDPVTGAAVPALRGAEILSRTPGLAGIADVQAIDWGLVPASHLRFAQILDIARILEATLADPGVVGAVVVQGTDVIEETAFAWDLLLGTTSPVVVVGAMRSADDPGYEGPANLRDAVRAAAAPALRGQGVLVAMGGRLLPADDVRKTDSHAYDTFRAPNRGAIGSVTAGEVAVHHARSRRRQLPRIPAAAAEPIALVTAVVSMDGTPIRGALAAGARGIVVEATGAGNTDPDLLLAATEAMASGVPVVLVTRCLAGRPTPTYGFPGGGRSWFEAGAIPGGTLGGPKARVALALGLGAGLDGDGLRGLFGA